jgi:hypothetical protein
VNRPGSKTKLIDQLTHRQRHSTEPVPQEDLIETVRCTEGDGSSVDLPGHGASGLPEGLTLVEVVECC